MPIHPRDPAVQQDQIRGIVGLDDAQCSLAGIGDSYLVVFSQEAAHESQTIGDIVHDQDDVFLPQRSKIRHLYRFG